MTFAYFEIQEDPEEIKIYSVTIRVLTKTFNVCQVRLAHLRAGVVEPGPRFGQDPTAMGGLVRLIAQLFGLLISA
jgi:hypothetical protein